MVYSREQSEDMAHNHITRKHRKVTSEDEQTEGSSGVNVPKKHPEQQQVQRPKLPKTYSDTAVSGQQMHCSQPQRLSDPTCIQNAPDPERPSFKERLVDLSWGESRSQDLKQFLDWERLQGNPASCHSNKTSGRMDCTGGASAASENQSQVSGAPTATSLLDKIHAQMWAAQKHRATQLLGSHSGNSLEEMKHRTQPKNPDVTSQRDMTIPLARDFDHSRMYRSSSSYSSKSQGERVYMNLGVHRQQALSADSLSGLREMAEQIDWGTTKTTLDNDDSRLKNISSTDTQNKSNPDYTKVAHIRRLKSGQRTDNVRLSAPLSVSYNSRPHPAVLALELAQLRDALGQFRVASGGLHEALCNISKEASSNMSPKWELGDKSLANRLTQFDLELARLLDTHLQAGTGPESVDNMDPKVLEEIYWAQEKIAEVIQITGTHGSVSGLDINLF